MTMEWMNRDELATYLRLDVEPGNVNEKVRNLIRRHGLPVVKRAGLVLFRRVDVDAWLEGAKSGRRMRHPARLPAK